MCDERKPYEAAGASIQINKPEMYVCSASPNHQESIWVQSAFYCCINNI